MCFLFVVAFKSQHVESVWRASQNHKCCSPTHHNKLHWKGWSVVLNDIQSNSLLDWPAVTLDEYKEQRVKVQEGWRYVFYPLWLL